MVNKLTLKQLKTAIAKERAKAKTATEKAQLQRELKMLREGTNTKLLRRFGRGFKELAGRSAKATGKGIVKAQKFAESTGAGRGLDVELRSSIPRSSRTRAVKRAVRRRANKRRSSKGRRLGSQSFKFFGTPGELNF